MEACQQEGFQIPHLDVEKALEMAKRLKKDLDQGEDWTPRFSVNNEYTSSSKTFPQDEVPVKLLYRFHNLPMSAKTFIEMMQASNLEKRAKWDKTTVLETLESLPNGGSIIYSLVELSFPLANRDYVLYMTPPTEIDWFGRKAFAIFFLDGTHPSKPPGADGIVRATNGGNFYISVQDEKEPGNKCETFMMTANNYNGWIPNKAECIIEPKASKVFYEIRQNVVAGHEKYFI